MKKQNKVLIGFLALFALSGCWNENKSSKCDENLEGLKQTISSWLREAMIKKDNEAKEFNIKITDIQDIYEYISSPQLMATSLYENYKDSRVCKATATVDFSGGFLKRSGSKDIDIRYQHTQNLEGEKGVRMASSDVSDLGKEGVAKLVEVIKEQKIEDMQEIVNQAKALHAPIYGGSNHSRNSVLEFFDFSCQYSKKIANDITGIVDEQSENPSVQFVFVPLSFVKDISKYQAKAAYAANKQNLFMEYYVTVMRIQRDMTEQDVDKVCENIGMDMEKYRQDMKDPEIEREVQELSNLAKKWNVKGVPTVFVNGGIVENPNYNSISKELKNSYVSDDE